MAKKPKIDALEILHELKGETKTPLSRYDFAVMLSFENLNLPIDSMPNFDARSPELLSSVANFRPETLRYASIAASSWNQISKWNHYGNILPAQRSAYKKMADIFAPKMNLRTSLATFPTSPFTKIWEILHEAKKAGIKFVAYGNLNAEIEFCESIKPFAVLTRQMNDDIESHIQIEILKSDGKKSETQTLNIDDIFFAGPAGKTGMYIALKDPLDGINKIILGKMHNDSPLVSSDLFRILAQGNQLLSKKKALYFERVLLPDFQETILCINPDRTVKPPEQIILEGELEISYEASRLSDTNDWLDLRVRIRVEGREIPLKDIITALTLNKSTLTLEDGAIVPLNSPELFHLQQLLSEAHKLKPLRRDENGEVDAQISKYNLSLLNDFDKLSQSTEKVERWNSDIQDLLDFVKLNETPDPPSLPLKMNATLRPYQIEGFEWLKFLFDHRLGGILADDMGLGKTLTVLTLIAKISEENKAAKKQDLPFLIVAPASVVSNWVSETQKFVPELKVAAKFKSQKGSAIDYAKLLDSTDILVMSYAVFRLDQDYLEEFDFAGLVLDEAQFVKNPSSLSAKTARTSKIPFKLAVTGTPMENNLSELWSIFAIVAPGLFPSMQIFKRTYVKKISQPKVLEKLRLRIAPLFLRRTKEKVAPELPAKIEQVLTIELNPRHKKFYDTYLQKERQNILGLADDMNSNRFQILRSLTILRQLSLDVKLINHEETVASSKIEVLLEMLSDIISGGHRCLIFSQFTSFLALIADAVQAAGYTYQYLDGSTRNRSETIKAFRNGTDPLFLISLKSGGFGINLTEADYVFIMDPWWNPAVESQAIDRSHRLGQNKQVMVYRLIAKDTIEEKVMQLKSSKSDLVDSLFSENLEFKGVFTADIVRELFS